jgi:Pirin C-terminal cupin domain
VSGPVAIKDVDPSGSIGRAAPPTTVITPSRETEVGELADGASPAQRDTDDDGDRGVEPGHLAYLGTGRDELRLTSHEGARALLLGGVPFPEPILMWWNFVARTEEEISEAHRDWSRHSPRFGPVASSLSRNEVDPPPWIRRPEGGSQ